ncbi:MAG TPA: DNA repair protein RecN, partial [Nakamurella sp.]
MRIADLGVIDEALIEPDPGFTVVTGETGAGKTMVVTALGLIGGGRGDAGKVRAGADRASVEIRWAPSGGGHDPSAEDSANVVVSSGVNSVVNSVGGRFDEDGTLIAARTVGADGRSRAHVGGRAVPLGTLADLAEPLIAVHGQSEAISLLRPGPQRAVLDRFAGLTAEVTLYRELRARCQRLTADLADRR